MFQKGEYVVHENSGVCRVEEISEMAMSGRGSEKLYYTLVPKLEESSHIYTLVDAPKVRVRQVMSREEIEQLLNLIPDVEIRWEKNDKVRTLRYKEALAAFEPEKLLEVIKTIYWGKQKRLKEGKKILTGDERYYQIAGRKLYDEIAFALEIDIKQAERIVLDRIRHADALLAV